MAEPKPIPNSTTIEQVKQTATELKNQACTLSMQHIQDGMLRLQFNREVACYTQKVIGEVEDGLKSAQEAAQELWRENAELREEIWTFGKHGIGAAAGALQIAGGAGLCYGSGGLACIPAAGLMAHGANNIYENVNNLIERRSDTEGWLRQRYQFVFRSKSRGNIAYGLTDILGSAYGAYRLIPSKNARPLFRHIDSDFVRAYTETAPWILSIDAFSTGVTTYGVAEELSRDNE
ncbi:DUF4225 domain-containing protein [Pseudomonas quasicaspiana]|uniref:DUF4225 domain-containing protein n=1 Tax=Pseudomonas quasicaspiana TaxID=2829821 RepID=UPI001E436034|nr:DUF4225 domain-containing protein [Pseudomonas quasicaspiana]MCD5970331.1 DUF4225 domain-containing protein [Pseudomonas quasicaspiana]